MILAHYLFEAMLFSGITCGAIICYAVLATTIRTELRSRSQGRREFDEYDDTIPHQE